MKEKERKNLCSEFSSHLEVFMKKHKVLIKDAVPLFCTFLGDSMRQAKMDTQEAKKFLEIFLVDYHNIISKVKNESTKI